MEKTNNGRENGVAEFSIYNQVKTFESLRMSDGIRYYCRILPATLYEHHCHADFYEFALIANGTFTHYYNGQKTLLHIGDLLYVRPNEYHAIRGETADDLHYVFVAEKEWFERIAARQPAYLEYFTNTPLAVRTLPHQQYDYVSYLAGVLAGRVPPPNSDLIAEQLLSSLLLFGSQELNPQSHFGVQRYVNHLIWEFNSYRLLCENIGRIYQDFPASQTTLINHFKQTTGKSIVEYRHQKRMEYAAHLLAVDNYQVTTVAGLVGFSSMSYFSSLFKEFHGMSPKQYQLAHRQNK